MHASLSRLKSPTALFMLVDPISLQQNGEKCEWLDAIASGAGAAVAKAIPSTYIEA